MNTQEMKVTADGTGIQEALELTERTAEAGWLNRQETLRLRLMAEELLGLMRSVTGEQEAVYRIVQNNRDYELRLTADVHLTKEIRERLLSVSTSGENAASAGFMGKLKEMIDVFLLPGDERPSLLSVGLMAMGSPGGYRTGNETYNWSLKKYREEVEARNDAEASGELEQSIVASIADEITVRIEGTEAEITLFKSF